MGKISTDQIAEEAWKSWTPTFTNFTKGSATILAKYQQIGKTVHFKIKITLNGSTMGTGMTVSLPVTAASDYAGPIGVGDLRDANGAYSQCFIMLTGATAFSLQLMQTAAGTNPVSIVWKDVTSVAPFTWANGDIIVLSGTYEAA